MEETIVGGCAVGDDALALVLWRGKRSVLRVLEGPHVFETSLGTVETILGVASRGAEVFTMGMAGQLTAYRVTSGSSRKPRLSKLKEWRLDLGDYGSLKRVRVIGGEVYCCGQFAQVYRLDGPNWVKEDHGLCSYESPDFQDLGGSGRADLFGTSLSGEVRHFDGQKWSRLKPAGPSHVLCTARLGKVQLFGGFDGFVGRVSGKAVKAFRAVTDGTYWDCVGFRERWYLCHGRGIDACDGRGVRPVKLGLSGELSFHRLCSSKKFLWSIGEQHVLRFDGQRWSRLASA